jgi:hypothetical protein
MKTASQHGTRRSRVSSQLGPMNHPVDSGRRLSLSLSHILSARKQLYRQAGWLDVRIVLEASTWSWLPSQLDLLRHTCLLKR